MKSKLYVILISLTTLVSCQGQNNLQTINLSGNKFITGAPDTVKALGDNLMIVYQDTKNNYWFGSWKEGLFKYDGHIIEHYTTTNGWPDNRIEEIKEDNSGNIYFNTSRGVVKYTGTTFTILTISESDNQWKLEPNDLWFKDGWNSNTILRYDGNLLYRLQLPKIKIGEDYIKRFPTNSNPYTVYSIYRDSKGNIWFGTGAMGAMRFNGQSFDWIVEKDVAEIYNEPDEPSNGVRSIIEDEDGYFWFNSKFKYKVYAGSIPDEKNQDSIFYKREQNIGSLDGIKDGNLIEYLSIVKDNNKELWIATYNSGVWHYAGNKINHHIIKDGSKEITLFTIYKDNSGVLWLGTHDSGAYKFNGKTFERFEP